ncbi:putative autophagy-related protein 11 [Macrosteles quadrilineatus]|uniref:putative autophagy-related protein 11 n=1 Tax=Macrosteles quadrilineatus TaxID=74068 RepID=UPI0023E28B51|nr:putative autophagy-related protein 11 [Macrosteles quadrilineatus]
MRTVRRDGDLITEDHELLNPDGTVTKTVTTTDHKTGQRQVSVYRMDKSGIVRKLDESDLKLWAESAKKEKMMQQLRDQVTETQAKIDAIKEHHDREGSKSVAYETKDGQYLKRVEEDAEPDKLDLAYSIRNINKPIELTAKQRAMVEEHKQNILNYGTQKLIKQLNKKLHDDKFNEMYSLTDNQKEKVIEYGIRKLHRLLEKNLDDERLVYDVMSFNPDFGKVDLSGRGERHLPGSQSISFALNPYKEMSPEEYAKPISFNMRPESKPLTETENQDGKRVVNNAYKAIWNKLMNHGSNQEQGGELKNNNNYSKDNTYDSDSGKTYPGRQSVTAQGRNDQKDIKEINNSVKELIKNDDFYKKSPLSPAEKDDIINYALNQVRSVFKDSVDEEGKDITKRKKKIDLSHYFDEDEIYEYGKKALKKLVRRSLKAFDLDQDMVDKDLDNPDQSARRDAFFQYLGDIVEGRVKESDPIPLPSPVKKQTKKEEQDEENKWDYQSFLSSVFGKNENEKIQNQQEKPKEQPEKKTDFDSLFSWLKDLKEDKTDSNKGTSQPNENVLKVKPHFYQLDPKTDSKNEQHDTQSETNNFDLKSLLKKIQEAAVKKFSNTSETSINNELPSGNVNKNDSHERQLKQSDVDLAMSRIRQNNNEPLKKPTTKPSYFKERIAGLDSIPRPTITTVSPPGRSSDLSDQISFKLRPHSYENTNKLEDKSRPENQKNDASKSSSHEQDFQPWWFESPDSFIKKAFEKPLKEPFIETPMIDGSFSKARKGFSAGEALKSILN